MTEENQKFRLDKWLWHARFFKSRSLATALCKSGKIRLNGAHVTKSSALVHRGDTLTFPRAEQLLIVKVLDFGTRRGPATEAQLLYEDLTPPPPKTDTKTIDPAQREKGAGRPTKADRRAIDKLMSRL